MFTGKKILLGICGSIAAYKAAFLTRLLVKAGADVQVVMTSAASTFIAPLTLSTLSKNPVYSIFENEETGEWTNHVKLGFEHDLFLIAPATANTLAKMANGICDNLLLTTYLSAKCPVIVAPAMDLDMWKHTATQNNIQTLQDYGVHVIPVESGELASGLTGAGRMAEPEQIVAYLESFQQTKKKTKVESLPLQGKRALITAGPTYEPIDPVRFIGNRSTGKMGICIAEELANQGADVHLVLGPSKLNASNNVKVSHVKTASEMYEAVISNTKDSDIIIMAAAVADYTPKEKSAEKIKKSNGMLDLDLIQTKDILKTVGSSKTNDQILVGFALETNNEIENAKRKLESKNLDFIVLNSLRNKGAGFGTSTNQITVLNRENNITNFELKPKELVATDIVDYLIKYIDA